MSAYFQASNKDFWSRIRSVRGQATVEYVLLLVVTIGLLIAVAAQVFTPFNKWAKTYMGSYIGCLLDAGELPMLGTTGSGADNICNGKFEQFSIGSGRSPKTGSSAEEAANRKNLMAIRIRRPAVQVVVVPEVGVSALRTEALR